MPCRGRDNVDFGPRGNAVTTGGPPNRLRERHLLMAYMVVGGATNAQIAAKLDYNANRVSIIRQSPLFQAYIQQLRRDLEEQTVSDIAEWIRKETPATLERLGELRDQGDELGVSLGAVKEILARASPIVAKTQEERVVRIAIGIDDRRMMQTVLDEDGVAPAHEAESEANVAGMAPAPATIQTLDEALADVREER